MFNFLSKAEEPEGGRGVATGVYRYVPPQNQSTFKNVVVLL